MDDMISAASGASSSLDEAAAPGLGELVRRLDAPFGSVGLAARESVATVDGPDSGTEFRPDEADLALIPDFVAESREHLQSAEASLLALEVDPEDSDAIDTVFRVFHTIKGTSGFLGLDPITELAHHAESLFDRFRSREIRCTGRRADASLHSVDLMAALFDSLQELPSHGSLQIPDGYGELLEQLMDPEAAGLLQEEDEPAAHTSDGPPMRLGDILVAEGKADRASLEAVVANRGDTPIGLALVQARAASLLDVARALRKQQRPARPVDAAPAASVRVRTDRLDRLAELLGELESAHARIARDPALASDLSGQIGRAGRIVRELQELSDALRAVQLHATFQKVARLVRDVAQRCGKRVELVARGEETEVDRRLAEVLGDPLVHMVRNAVDHGIETPEVRVAAGKPPVGTLHLSAYRSDGDLVVELVDDGRGLDRGKILEKARANGVVDPDRVPSDSEVLDLIFAPGFSTAEQVTDLSGRGVGLDVVKRALEAVRGSIEVASEPGRGCTFVIRLPAAR